MSSFVCHLDDSVVEEDLRRGRLWLWCAAGDSAADQNWPTAPDATRIGRCGKYSCMGPKPHAFKRSELQAAFARGIGQRLDAAVVAVAGAVERDLLDAGGLGLLGDRA